MNWFQCVPGVFAQYFILSATSIFTYGFLLLLFLGCGRVMSNEQASFVANMKGKGEKELAENLWRAQIWVDRLTQCYFLPLIYGILPGSRETTQKRQPSKVPFLYCCMRGNFCDIAFDLSKAICAKRACDDVQKAVGMARVKASSNHQSVFFEATNNLELAMSWCIQQRKEGETTSYCHFMYLIHKSYCP